MTANSDLDEDEFVFSDRLNSVIQSDSYKQYLNLLPADSSIERSKGRAMSEEDSDMFSFRTSTISNPNYQADPTASDGTLYPDLPGENVPVGEAIEAELDPLDEMKTELRKTEEEIDTLRQVLHAKENYASELRKKLGMTPLGQISSTFKQELNRVQSSNAYKKTSETLKSAGQSTASAFSTFGSTMSQKLNEMKNSQAFKSMEEKVEGVSTAIMAKVSGTGVEKQPEEGEEATESTPVTTQPQQAPEKASE